jgi:hypothetical protein
MIVNIDDWHLLFAGMHGAAVLALAQIFVVVELFKQGRQIADNAFQLHFRAIHKMMTALTVPFEPIQIAFWPRHFDYNAETSLLMPLRRVAHVFG